MGERDGRKWESEEGNEGKRTEMKEKEKEKEKESYFVLVAHQQM